MKKAKKDWVGGRAAVFKTLGASNHAEHERAWGDYYATEPKATEWLLKLEQFDGPILEPACGEGHISEVLTRGGVFRHFAGPYRSRLWRSGRFPCHRQPEMERRHRYQSAIRLRSGVRGEGTIHHSRWKESVHVPEVDLSGRQRTEAPLQDTTTSTGMGQLFEAAMRHERQV